MEPVLAVEDLRWDPIWRDPIWEEPEEQDWVEVTREEVVLPNQARSPLQGRFLQGYTLGLTSQAGQIALIVIALVRVVFHAALAKVWEGFFSPNNCYTPRSEVKKIEGSETQKSNAVEAAEEPETHAGWESEEEFVDFIQDYQTIRVGKEQN